MPVLSGCETEPDAKAKKQCTEAKLIKYVSFYAKMNYPKEAKKNKIEGLVVVSFVVNKEGKIEDVKCIRDIGGGCGAETVRIMEAMNEQNSTWTPGKQRGQAVNVRYTMPVRFKLQEEEKEEEEIEDKEIEKEQLFTVVEEMPMFPGCETEPDAPAKKQCTETNLLKYVYENLKYPEAAKKDKIKGIVIVSFVINKEGKIKNVTCVRDIGSGCGAEAVRIVESMNENNIVWTPGKQRGQAVSVKYNLPVRFIRGKR